jgi:predicted metal-dependent phosphoesterase TrpH
MGYADLHIHSIQSYDGTSSIPAILKYTADRTDLNVIAITDHDTMAGVREATMLAPRYGIEVIPGCEVSTAEGHLLALFISECIPAGLSLAETIHRVGQQGGLCIAPHPEARGTSSLTIKAIQKALLDPETARILVGVETFNGGLVYTRSNQTVLHQVKTLDIAHIGNSDSHILQTIGEGSTEFEGRSASDLRRALEEHSTMMRIGRGLQGAVALRHWVPKFLLRKMGWVTWNEKPELPLRYARMKVVAQGTFVEDALY